MDCSRCKTPQDGDARFCTECGAQLEGPAKKRSAYTSALLLLPVIVLACAVGYYKFFLPQGIAAVVNGEAITRADLEQEVARTDGRGAGPEARYHALNTLIRERVMLQEARKAGTDVSPAEVKTAIEDIRTRSGLDEARFNKQAESQFGSREKFEDDIRSRLLISKYVAAHVVPQGADRKTATQLVDRWAQTITDAAGVRITLAEQWSGAACGCCNKGAAAKGRQAGPGSAQRGCPMAKNEAGTVQAGRAADVPNSGRAAEAGLAYWHEKHGNDAVTAKVTDFGCHQQVDIVKDNKTVGSLRYQNGSISE